jgi:chromosomal replication initiator protein
MDRTQEVFFHIFNHLHQSGKQIVLASDKSPLEIKDVDERLITRFKWGFSGELHRPDFSLRRDILKNKVERDGVSLSDEVIDFIAKNVRDNVRDLEVCSLRCWPIPRFQTSR